MARQYCGALGKIGNCQVGGCLAYAGPRGHTLLDRELYLLAAWTDDPVRLEAVGLAPDTPFATKPQLAQRMLARTLDDGLSVAWVTGNTFYGRSTDLRRWLEDAGQHHVLAVPRNESLWVGRDIRTPEAVHAVHADQEWYRLGAGAGSKGERWYDWQCWVLAEPEDADWGRDLLYRRSLADPDDWQAYGPSCRRAATWRRWWPWLAASRPSSTPSRPQSKQETGLDDYEVRSAHGWYRHLTLALWALVPLASPSPVGGARQPLPAATIPARLTTVVLISKSKERQANEFYSVPRCQNANRQHFPLARKTWHRERNRSLKPTRCYLSYLSKIERIS